MSGFIKLSSPSTREFWKIPVLFEDEHFLVLEKPAKVATSPDRLQPERPSLVQLLHAAVADKKPWTTERDLHYLMPAHRLDYEATGTLFLAKSKQVLQSLANLIGSNKPIQSWLALVKGSPQDHQFDVELAMAQDPKFPGRMRIDALRGKKSKTRFEVRERFRGFTLLQCYPLSQRRHQIRVHLRQARLPVCGDTVYGGRPLMLSSLKPNYRLKPHRTEKPLIASPALHAHAAAFEHPMTGQPFQVEAPLPKPLQVALKYLRLFASDSAPAGEMSVDE